MTTTAAPVRPAPVETVTPIKPSEAIRLGCLLAPVQAFDDYENGYGSACVKGAFNLGMGRSVDHDFRDRRIFGRDPQPPCPECGKRKSRGLAHLNDKHRWSREQIAGWLAGLGR